MMSHKLLVGNLSVTADEFVPKYSTKIPLSATLSADVPEFVPKWKQSNELTKRGRFVYYQKDVVTAQSSCLPETSEIVKHNEQPLSEKFTETQNQWKENRTQSKPVRHSKQQHEQQRVIKEVARKDKVLHDNKPVVNNIQNAKPLSWSAIVQQPAKSVAQEEERSSRCKKDESGQKTQDKSSQSRNSKQNIEKNKRDIKPNSKYNGERESNRCSNSGKLQYSKNTSSVISNSSRPPEAKGILFSDKHSIDIKQVGKKIINTNKVSVGDEKPSHKENNDSPESNVKTNTDNNSVKYEKKKLTRTFKSFSTSSIETESESRFAKNGLYMNHIKNDQRDILTVRELVNSYKKVIQKGREPFKVVKSKHKMQKDFDKNEDNEVFETIPIKQDLKDDSAFPMLTANAIPPPAILSYSGALKKPSAKTHATNTKQLSEDEKIALRKKRKTEKRKLKVKLKKKEKQKELEVSILAPETKKSETEMKLDLSDMFGQLLANPSNTKKLKSQKQKKAAISTGVISVAGGLAKKNTPDGRRKKEAKSDTILDGTNLIKKRGKERELPKKKKPTLLKKIIKAERERKKKLMEKTNVAKEELVDDEKVKEEAVVLIEAEQTKVEPKAQESEDAKEEKHVSSWNNLPEHLSKKLHSRKFREYCNHVLTKDINTLAITLLTTLQKFQDRVYHETPLKFKQKRRFVLGLREVLKHLKVKKLKAVVIAPNLERISSEGGLDDYLTSILSICTEQNIPQIFAMNRHALGRTLKKKAPVSVVGVFNYDGAQDIFKELMENVRAAQTTYNNKVTELMEGEFGHIPDISLTIKETDLSFEDFEPFQNPAVESESEILKRQILGKFTAEEFRIVRTHDDGSVPWVTNAEGYHL